VKDVLLTVTATPYALKACGRNVFIIFYNCTNIYNPYASKCQLLNGRRVQCATFDSELADGFRVLWFRSVSLDQTHAVLTEERFFIKALNALSHLVWSTLQVKPLKESWSRSGPLTAARFGLFWVRKPGWFCYSCHALLSSIVYTSGSQPFWSHVPPVKYFFSRVTPDQCILCCKKGIKYIQFFFMNWHLYCIKYLLSNYFQRAFFNGCSF